MFNNPFTCMVSTPAATHHATVVLCVYSGSQGSSNNTFIILSSLLRHFNISYATMLQV